MVARLGKAPWFESFDVDAEVEELLAHIVRCTGFALPERQRDVIMTHARSKLDRTRQAYLDAKAGVCSGSVLNPTLSKTGRSFSIQRTAVQSPHCLFVRPQRMSAMLAATKRRKAGGFVVRSALPNLLATIAVRACRLSDLRMFSSIWCPWTSQIGPSVGAKLPWFRNRAARRDPCGRKR